MSAQQHRHRHAAEPASSPNTSPSAPTITSDQVRSIRRAASSGRSGAPCAGTAWSEGAGGAWARKPQGGPGGSRCHLGLHPLSTAFLAASDDETPLQRATGCAPRIGRTCPSSLSLVQGLGLGGLPLPPSPASVLEVDELLLPLLLGDLLGAGDLFRSPFFGARPGGVCLYHLFADWSPPPAPPPRGPTCAASAPASSPWPCCVVHPEDRAAHAGDRALRLHLELRSGPPAPSSPSPRPCRTPASPTKPLRSWPSNAASSMMSWLFSRQHHHALVRQRELQVGGGPHPRCVLELDLRARLERLRLASVRPLRRPLQHRHLPDARQRQPRQRQPRPASQPPTPTVDLEPSLHGAPPPGVSRAPSTGAARPARPAPHGDRYRWCTAMSLPSSPRSGAAPRPPAAPGARPEVAAQPLGDPVQGDLARPRARSASTTSPLGASAVAQQLPGLGHRRRLVLRAPRTAQRHQSTTMAQPLLAHQRPA